MQHLSGEAKRPVADEWENGPTKRQRVAPGSHSNSEATDPELKVNEWAADLIVQGSGRRGPSGTSSAEPAAATVISDGTESSEDEQDSSLEIVEKDASTTVAEPELESVLWHPDPSQKAPPRWHTPIMHYTDVSNIWSIKMVNPERSYRLWRGT